MRSCGRWRLSAGIERITLVAQVPAGRTAAQRRVALEMGLVARRGGATHVIVGFPPADRPAAVDLAAREIAEPLRDAG